MLYRLENVRKSFGTKDVLVDATWQHDPGRIVGLVGRNGAGKSTVLKIVQGLVEPDGGKLHVAGGATFASLDQAVEPEGDEPLRAFVARAQEPLLELERTMRSLEEAISSHGADGDRTALDSLLAEHDEVREHFERAGGYEADSRIDRVLDGVGLARPLWDRPVGELSGGQKHRAQIARLLLTDASVLLLDEPTNHLDVSGIEFLEGWLVERKTGAGLAALVVSHDRRFLDAVADRIVEVAHGRLEEYPGDYATYRKLKAERDRLRAKEAEKQRQMIERTEDFIRRNIAGQKTKQAQGRRKMLARIERIEA
ncbi:MAG TPA: ATP-binding cassette domain-containing protein, partial [Thermoanaerobaculia bacterium]